MTTADSSLTQAQVDIIDDALNRWGDIIRHIPGFAYELAIETYTGEPGQGLAYAGPTHIDINRQLPAKGRIVIDLQDLNGNGAKLDTTIVPGTNKTSLFYTALHEIGHALGIGTFWQLNVTLSNGQTIIDRNWLIDQTTGQPITVDGDNLTTEVPIYTGPTNSAALREYRKVVGQQVLGIPIEDDGGTGTALGHVEEGEIRDVALENGTTIFNTHVGMDDELMTGWIDHVHMPLSKVTIGFLEDIGWSVDYSGSD